MNFYIDGIRKGNWKGEKDWALETYMITPGEHTFTWAYKNRSDCFGNPSSGSNCAWIDNISLYVGTPPIPADFTGDDKVDFQDFAELAKFWGYTGRIGLSVDIAPPPNGGGIIDWLDLAVLAGNWIVDMADSKVLVFHWLENCE